MSAIQERLTPESTNLKVYTLPGVKLNKQNVLDMVTDVCDKLNTSDMCFFDYSPYVVGCLKKNDDYIMHVGLPLEVIRTLSAIYN